MSKVKQEWELFDKFISDTPSFQHSSLQDRVDNIQKSLDDASSPDLRNEISVFEDEIKHEESDHENIKTEVIDHAEFYEDEKVYAEVYTKTETFELIKIEDDSDSDCYIINSEILANEAFPVSLSQNCIEVYKELEHIDNFCLRKFCPEGERVETKPRSRRNSRKSKMSKEQKHIISFFKRKRAKKL